MGGSLPPFLFGSPSQQKLWQQQINDAIAIPRAPRPPFNLSAVGTAGHIVLSWEVVPGADGYEIQASKNGDFSTVSTSSVRGGDTITFPDATLQAGDTRWYRVRSTSGTDNNPQVAKGQWTAAIKQTVGGAVVYDQYTHTPSYVTPIRRSF